MGRKPISLSALAGVVAGLAVVLAVTTPAAAGSRPVACEIVVKGRTYVKQVCQFTPDGPSFQIDAGDYFAQVQVQGNTAELSWNGTPGATHAQSVLGTARREGSCWISPIARVCARDLPASQAKALAAAAPSGGNLQLVDAGYPCLGVADHTLGLGRLVVLQACRFPADNIWIKDRDGALAVSKRPDLCLVAEAPGPGKPPRLVVDACRPDLPRWRVGSGPEGAAITSSAGDCLTVPLLAHPDSKFPYPASAARCTELGGKAPRFAYEIPN